MTPEKKAKLAEGRRRRDITAVYDRLHQGKLGAHVLWCMVEQVAAGQSEVQVMRDYGYELDQREGEPPTHAQTALNVAEVGEFAAQSASRHLAALLDVERQISDRAMAVMNALQEAASPIEGEHMDCFVPAAAYRQFVDAHAELLYVRKHGAKPAVQAVQA